MTSFFINAENGDDLECQVTCEQDETVFLAVVFDKSNAAGDSVFEGQATNEDDIIEFFRQVGEAKKDFERLTGKKLD